MLVEKRVGVGRVPIDAVGPLEEPERDKRIQEVARRPRMQPNASAERVEILRTVRQLRKQLHFDRAQQRL